MSDAQDAQDATDPIGAALRRGDVLAALCPSRSILKQVTTRWAVLSLLALRRGAMRFSALRQAIGGVSERMLAKTLQDLAAHGLVLRVSLPVSPPHVEYSLTPLGEEMAERVEALTSWIEGAIHRFPSAATQAAPDAPAQPGRRAPRGDAPACRGAANG